MTKKKIKDFWERNKKKIVIAGAAIVGTGVSLLMIKNCHGSSDAVESVFKSKPSRKIPEVDGFKILDIAEDVNDGCVTWMDSCKLSDCGKLGEGLCKIERVNPEMNLTMAILAKNELDL